MSDLTTDQIAAASVAENLTREEIQALSPDLATKALAALQARHDVAKSTSDKFSPEAIRAMTPAEATAALLERRPLGADGKPIPAPSYSGIVSSHELQARQAEVAMGDLEATGFPPRGTAVGDDLHAMLEGRTPVTPEVEKAVRAKHKQCLADRAWGQRLLQGDAVATREFYIMGAFLAAVEVQRPTRFGTF